MIFDHPWLGAMFGDTEIAALWSPEAQLEHYRAFECALALALEAHGHVGDGVGRSAAQAIKIANIEMAKLAEATERDGLPIPEFVRQLRAAADASSVAIHNGATSQDVLDTALSLTLRATTDIVVDRLKALDTSLQDLMNTHGTRPLMARTRMQAALPINVANRVENWRQPLSGYLAALEHLRPQTERVQLGGPVGTRHAFGADGQKMAEHVAMTLRLHTGPAWHTDRTAISNYANQLSLITGSLGKIGSDIALMAQQGVDEIRLLSGGGSSAMPHKSNPVLAELLVTLARFNATQLSGMHHSLVHEQERSGSAWMLEWLILPQMAVTSGRALSATLKLVHMIECIGEP